MSISRDPWRATVIWTAAAVLTLAIALSPSSVLAENDSFLAGKWLVEGQDPDGSAYDGEVTLTLGANSLSYYGDIDGDIYIGTGLWNDETRALAVDFVEQSSGSAGLSLFVYQDGMLKGHWVYSDAPQEVGMETWRRPAS